MSPSYRHLFGPVRSRRFGRSLGVDLQTGAIKHCSLDCLFCQLGPTPATTVERRPGVPMAEVLGELDDWRRHDGRADFITLAGNGEPTLHPGFGEVLDWARRHGFRSLLLSNGTLFTLPEVRRAAARADVVKVSLHAWNGAMFHRLARPHVSLDFDAIVAGYCRFRDMFKGELVVEVFVVPGINDGEADLARVAEIARRIAPDRIQLNHAARPAAATGVRAVDPAKLARLAALFTPPAELPGVARPGGADPTLSDAELSDAVAALVCRHPADLDSLAETFGCHAARMRTLLESLAASGRIALQSVNGVCQAGPPGCRHAGN